MEPTKKKLTPQQIRRLLTVILLIAVIAWRIWGPTQDAAPPEADSPAPPQSSSVQTLPEAEPDSPALPESQPESDPDPPVREESDAAESNGAEAGPAIDEHGSYTAKEDVALYIYTYGRLPDNFITKAEAKELGWEGGYLEPYAPGCCIGGDKFGNYEGLLPEKKGRQYTECDIDTLGAKKRGAKRIVFSNDGLIYYTDDHYDSFELLYGEE